jgi:hypothetical protein
MPSLDAGDVAAGTLFCGYTSPTFGLDIRVKARSLYCAPLPRAIESNIRSRK